MKISVIIPVYNVEKYIEECLHSVYQQTYADLEVIVVDNNCSDNTVEKVKLFLEQTGMPIKVIKEKNQGLSYARNAGINACNGEWIQFLDADDLLLPMKIEHQVSLIDNNVDIIVGANVERDIYNQEQIILPLSNIPLALILGYRSLGSSCSNLWKKEVLERVGKFNEDFKSSEEYELLFKIYTSKASFKIDKEAYTIIRQRPTGQISQWNKSELSKEWLKLRDKQVRYFFEQQEVSFDDNEKKLIAEKTHMHIVNLIPKHSNLARYYYEDLYKSIIWSDGFIQSPKLIVYQLLYKIFGFVETRYFMNKLRKVL